MAKQISPNLKIGVGADTSGFTKGMDQTRKELRAFEKTSNDALSKIASAFGINTAQVEKLQNAFAGAGQRIAKMGDEGSKSLGAIVASAGKAATAIGAIGIGAAVTAFKLLNDEATAFKNTVQGANIELQTQAYLETYRQAIHDYNEGIGKSMAETESDVKEWWGRIWQNIKTGAVTAITQPVFSGANTLSATFANAWTETGKAAEYALDKAEQARPIAARIYELERQRVKQSEELARINAQIAEYQNIARDTTNTVAERQTAMAQIQTLISQKEAMTVSLEQELAVLYKQNSDLASDSVEAENALYAQKVKAYEAERAITNERTALLKLQKQINTAAASEAEIRRQTADIIAKGVERMQEYATAQIEMAVSPESVATLQNFLSTGLATKPVEVPVRLNTEQAQQEVLDLNDVIQQTMVQGIEGIAESIGTLLGNLMTGESGVADFGKDLLEMVGTFAQKFGSVLVAFGVASEAFKASLKSLNGVAAIAAGAALIVAGAAVKAVASNMASSMGGAAATSSSSYVASSGSYGASGLTNSTLQVEVTGTLTANGSQLVAVLNNENNRKYYTS